MCFSAIFTTHVSQKVRTACSTPPNGAGPQQLHEFRWPSTGPDRAMTMKRFWKTAWQKNDVLPKENIFRQRAKLQYYLKHRYLWLPFIAATLRFGCPDCDRNIRTDDRIARLSVLYIYISPIVVLSTLNRGLSRLDELLWFRTAMTRSQS